ncbi:NUDIX hydrolase [Candidatus Babeliales bacterium]|nr:NUDIX hydrolase [Candidatus Babeliales bacterium]
MNNKIVYLTPPNNFFSKFEVASCFCEIGTKVLFLKRSLNKTCGGTWCLPAGKLENKETSLDASVRETYEETGIVLKKNSVYFLKTVYVRYPEFDFVYHIFKTVLNEFPKIIKLNFEEHKEYGFFTIKEALSLNLIPGEKECIKLIYNF